MKVHTTNYQNTFIEIAEDCPATSGEIPPIKNDKKTAANIQFDLLKKHPYKYTSDDVLFFVYASKNDLTKNECEDARTDFFSKGQPCFRASPLTKRYGWGIHYDKDGKMAIFGAGSVGYKKLSADKNLKILRAMKSKK